jgi:uncharacterized protein YceH (UPF0502 family)
VAVRNHGYLASQARENATKEGRLHYARRSQTDTSLETKIRRETQRRDPKPSQTFQVIAKHVDDLEKRIAELEQRLDEKVPSATTL